MHIGSELVDLYYGSEYFFCTVFVSVISSLYISFIYGTKVASREQMCPPFCPTTFFLVIFSFDIFFCLCFNSRRSLTTQVRVCRCRSWIDSSILVYFHTSFLSSRKKKRIPLSHTQERKKLTAQFTSSALMLTSQIADLNRGLKWFEEKTRKKKRRARIIKNLERWKRSERKRER